MLIAPEKGVAIEVLVAARANGGDVQVVHFIGRGVGLMPGGVVAVTEGDEVGERVVVVDDEGEVTHRLISSVGRDREGLVGLRVFVDEVRILDPGRMHIFHPPAHLTRSGSHHEGQTYFRNVDDMIKWLLRSLSPTHSARSRSDQFIRGVSRNRCHDIRISECIWNCYEKSRSDSV